MITHIKLILCSLLILQISCSSNQSQFSSPDYMIFDNVLYISKFPKTFELDNALLISCDIPGAKSITIRDSLLVVSTNNDKGFWSFFSLPAVEFRGKYLLKGNGPIELLTSPWVEKQHFYNSNGDLHSIVHDFSTGKLLNFNISETLRKNSAIINKLELNVANSLFNLNIINDSTYYCKSVNETHTQQDRYVLCHNKKNITKNMELLNSTKIKTGGDINLLTTISTYDSITKHIVECSIMLNQVNIFSIDSTFAVSICFGNKFDKILDFNKSEKKRTYMDINGYKKFFTALYYNQPRENLTNPSIQFMDWYGKPLMEVKLNKSISSTSIDFANKTLYGIDYKTEELYKFDISDAIDYLRSINY